MSAFEKAIQNAVETYTRLVTAGESVDTAAAEADALVAAYYAERGATA